MPSVPLGVGRITACWFVLRSLQRLGGLASKAELTTHASRTSLRSGGLPIRDGVVLVVEGGFVTETHDRVQLSDVGVTALRLGDEDEPTGEARRFLVTRLLLSDPPPWVAYWQGDPGALEHVLPSNERKTLLNADLLPPASEPEDLEAWGFWQALGRVPLMTETAAHRKHIGDAGEHLSVEYERARLLADGHEGLAGRVQWLARESDAYGFDILSFLGGTGGDADVRIAIEVKSTTLPRAANLHFYLSAHEWDTALRLGERYCVHVWTNIDPGPPIGARDPGPLVLDPSRFAPHLPEPPDCGARCRWQTAELYLPTAGVEPVGGPR
jgi:hypothetical protein